MTLSVNAYRKKKLQSIWNPFYNQAKMSGHDLGSSASSGAIWPEDTINSFETGQSLTQHARSSTSYNNIKKKKKYKQLLAIPSNLSVMRVSGHCTCASSTGSLLMVFIHCLVPALLYEGIQIQCFYIFVRSLWYALFLANKMFFLSVWSQ